MRVEVPEVIVEVPTVSGMVEVVYKTVPPAPNATEEPSVPVNVRVLEAVSVLPSAIVSVEPVAGVVMVTLLIEGAVATPSVGVVITGEVSVLLVRVSVVALPTSVSVAAGSVKVFDTAAAGGMRAIVPDEVPVKVMPCVPAITPVVSATVTAEFWIILPV